MAIVKILKDKAREKSYPLYGVCSSQAPKKIRREEINEPFLLKFPKYFVI